MATIDDLWAGQLTAMSFDPVGHGLDLTVEAVDNGVKFSYTVRCRAVTRLMFDNAIPLPWNYAEIVEAYVEPDSATHGEELSLMLWSEKCELRVSCQSVEIIASPAN